MKSRPDFETALAEEMAKLQGRRTDLLGELDILQSELGEVDERLGHIQALLMDHPSDNGKGQQAVPSEHEKRIDYDGEDPADLAFRILEGRPSSPMHYRELADLVVREGGILPGMDPAQTLVSRLVRDDRFVRPLRRGWYALRIHYPTARNVGSRKKRASRRSGE